MKLFFALCLTAAVSITAGQENDCPAQAASYCSGIHCSAPEHYRPGCKMLLNSSGYRQTAHCVCINRANSHIWSDHGEAYPGLAILNPCPPSSMGACAEDTICDSNQWEPTCKMLQSRETGNKQVPYCVCLDRSNPNHWQVKDQAWEAKDRWIDCTERHAEFSRAYCESGVINCGSDQWKAGCKMSNLPRQFQKIWCVCMNKSIPNSWYKVQEALRKPDDGRWP